MDPGSLPAGRQEARDDKEWRGNDKKFKQKTTGVCGFLYI